MNTEVILWLPNFKTNSNKNNICMAPRWSLQRTERFRALREAQREASPSQGPSRNAAALIHASNAYLTLGKTPGKEGVRPMRFSPVGRDWRLLGGD